MKNEEFSKLREQNEACFCYAESRMIIGVANEELRIKTTIFIIRSIL